MCVVWSDSVLIEKQTSQALCSNGHAAVFPVVIRYPLHVFCALLV